MKNKINSLYEKYYTSRWGKSLLESFKISNSRHPRFTFTCIDDDSV